MADDKPAEDIFTEVAESQPGTWPTSPLDLIEAAASEGDPVAIGEGTYLPRKRPMPQGSPAFSAQLRINGDAYHYELHVTGSARFIERMTHAMADAFFEESGGQ